VAPTVNRNVREERREQAKTKSSRDLASHLFSILRFSSSSFHFQAGQELHYTSKPTMRGASLMIAGCGLAPLTVI
jgi:hypothetical protein